MLCEEFKCTACGACMNMCPKNCISMVYDYEGFLMPSIDELECINCGLCENVCPEINPPIRDNKTQPQSIACWNKDSTVRFHSTSGGMFSVIARYILEIGGIVFGVILGDNLIPYHSAAYNIEQLKEFRGSKYIQSDMQYTFRDIKRLLENKKIILFSGTPCQVAGLISFLGKGYENLYTIEVICHGVGSTSLALKYFLYQETRWDSKIKKVIFRSKKNGWRVSTVCYELENGNKKFVKAYNDLFMTSFYSSLISRKSCTNCQHATLPRIADITLADYWGLEPSAVQTEEFNKGISLMLLNNDKAQKLFEGFKDRIIYLQRPLKEAIAGNRHLQEPTLKHFRREEFFADFNSMPIEFLQKKYCKKALKTKISIIIGPKLTEKIKKIIQKFTY